MEAFTSVTGRLMKIFLLIDHSCVVEMPVGRPALSEDG
jgi:hypothetical protein